MISSVFIRLIVPFLAPALLLGITVAISVRNPRAKVQLSRSIDGNVEAMVERSVLGILVSTEESKVVQNIEFHRSSRELELVGDPRVAVRIGDLGHPKLLEEFLDDREAQSLQIVCYPTLLPELLFGGLGLTLLLGAIAGIFYQLRNRIGVNETIDEKHLVDSSAPTHVTESLGQEQFFLKIRCWQPGKQIRIERNLSLTIYLMMLALSAMAGGLAGAWLFDEMGAIVLGPVGLIVMLAIFEYKMYYRVVRLDWSTKRLYWSFGPFWRSIDFDQVVKFQVLDVSSRDSNEHRSTLGLFVKCRSRPIILLDTLAWEGSRSQSRGKLEPLARELKKALRNKP